MSWRKQHSYLTLVADHQRRCVVWGSDGAGAEAADRFFAELDRRPPRPPLRPDPEPADIQAQPEPPDPATDVKGHEQHVGERACKLRAISMDMGPG